MKTTRWKSTDPGGTTHEMVTYTGDGGGEITFQAGNSRPVVTPGPVPRHDDDPGGIPNSVQAGRIGDQLQSHWEKYGQELFTRDEGDRGLPIDFKPPHHKDLGLRDHKDATADRMMQALHKGDFAYFEGLAKALQAYEKPGGKIRQRGHGGISAAREQGVEAIREAARIACGVPTVDAINNCYRQASCTNKDFRNQVLIPLGFGWILNIGRGKPKLG